MAGNRCGVRGNRGAADSADVARRNRFGRRGAGASFCDAITLPVLRRKFACRFGRATESTRAGGSTHSPGARRHAQSQKNHATIHLFRRIHSRPSADLREEKIERLAVLEQEAQRELSAFLNDICTRVVFGEGDPDAAIMFVGEGPGAEEDRTGRPFVDAAGNCWTK